MCDSFVAMADVCQAGRTIYGKVSDRAVNEPQYFVHVPAADHDCSKPLRCTFISVEQVPHTYEMILSKPSWIWGGEIGVNEFGVCAGNESVYSKEVQKEPALVGMDLVRLALERGRTAEESLDVATSLLERYGQGGNCSFDAEFYYDNSFFFIDANEAWVLETCGRYWAAKRVKGAYSISNFMSIVTPDKMHAGAIAHAKEMGYEVTEPFDFTRAFTNWAHTGNHNGMVRKLCSQRVLDAAGNNCTIRTAVQALQSHTTDDPFHSGNFSVCKHATGPDGLHQSTNSMIVELFGDGQMVIWGAGMSLPCCSLYKPFWFDVYSRDLVFDYTDQERAYDDWVRRERVLRAIGSGKIKESDYKAELKNLQESVYTRFDNLVKNDRAARQAFCEDILRDERAFFDRWQSVADGAEERRIGSVDFLAFWDQYNSQLGRNRTIFY